MPMHTLLLTSVLWLLRFGAYGIAAVEHSIIVSQKLKFARQGSSLPVKNTASELRLSEPMTGASFKKFMEDWSQANGKTSGNL